MLTERERKILELHTQGLSDYKIARRLDADPPSITKSRLNAIRKLQQAQQDLAWAQQIGILVDEKYEKYAKEVKEPNV